MRDKIGVISVSIIDQSFSSSFVSTNNLSKAMQEVIETKELAILNSKP